MVRKAFCTALALLLLGAASPLCMASGGAFPLSKGTIWRYVGETQWTEEGAEAPKSADVSWTMKVLEVLPVAKGEVALVHGMVTETSGFDPSRAPGYSVLLQTEGKLFEYWAEDEQEARRRLKELASSAAMPPESDALLVFPLKPGKSWGGEGNRDDHMYEWYVEESRETSLDIPGISPEASAEVCRIVLNTLPDTTIMEAAPGIGILRWAYEHHGTVFASDLRLVEFVRGGK